MRAGLSSDVVSELQHGTVIILPVDRSAGARIIEVQDQNL
jgi:hypothetical protein